MEDFLLIIVLKGTKLRQKSMSSKPTTEKAVRDIRRKTHMQYSVMNGSKITAVGPNIIDVSKVRHSPCGTEKLPRTIPTMGRHWLGKAITLSFQTIGDFGLELLVRG